MRLRDNNNTRWHELNTPHAPDTESICAASLCLILVFCPRDCLRRWALAGRYVGSLEQPRTPRVLEGSEQVCNGNDPGMSPESATAGFTVALPAPSHHLVVPASIAHG